MNQSAHSNLLLHALASHKHTAQTHEEKEFVVFSDFSRKNTLENVDDIIQAWHQIQYMETNLQKYQKANHIDLQIFCNKTNTKPRFRLSSQDDSGQVYTNHSTPKNFNNVFSILNAIRIYVNDCKERKILLTIENGNISPDEFTLIVVTYDLVHGNTL
jgi:hypothetical protein